MDDELAGRYSFDRIDRELHAPSRLGIVTALYAYSTGLSFVELREACELTDGNLSRQLRRLEESGIVKVEKAFVDRVPHTTAKLTVEGRGRFEEYLDTLDRLVTDHADRRKAPRFEPGTETR